MSRVSVASLGPAAQRQIEALLTAERVRGEMAAEKKSKYRNRKTEVDGVVFDSAAEARRWQELKLLMRHGAISDPQRQVVFNLDVNGDRVCIYRADFTYHEDGVFVVEDVKGVKTRDYVLKKKLMKAIYGIKIVEITKKGGK